MAVTLQYSPNRLQLEQAAGKTVAQIRAQAEALLGIPAAAIPSIDGNPVEPTRIVQDGQVLVFTRVQGEKGLES